MYDATSEEVEAEVAEIKEKEPESKEENLNSEDDTKSVISKKEDLKSPPEFKPDNTKEEKEGSDE